MFRSPKSRLATALLAFVPLVNGGELRLSLDESIVLWRQYNHGLKLARAAVLGAEADVAIAGQVPNPQISINALSISPQEGFGNGGVRDKRMDSILRFEQLIERGNKRALRGQAAQARLNASRSDFEDAQRQQRQALRLAYYDLMLTQEKQLLAADSAQLYGSSLVASELRLKVGDISKTDLARLRIEQQRADNDARQATAERERAQVALAYLIGKAAEARSLVATDPWQKAEALVDKTLDLGLRPDVRAARARVDAAEHARELAQSLKKRDVTVGVQLEHNQQNHPTNSFGLGLSMPLFVHHEYEGEIARAEAELQMARELLAQTETQAQGDVDQARADLLVALDRRKRLESGLLGDAAQVAKAAEFAYVKGAMGLIDLLDARRTWRQIQLEAAQARADHARALVSWHTAIGDPVGAPSTPGYDKR